MAQLRAQHGFTLMFPKEFSESATKLLALAPPEWPQILEITDSKEKLLEWATRFPAFSPAWALLAQLAHRTGDSELHAKAEQGYAAAEAIQAKL